MRWQLKKILQQIRNHLLPKKMIRILHQKKLTRQKKTQKKTPKNQKMEMLKIRKKMRLVMKKTLILMKM